MLLTLLKEDIPKSSSLQRLHDKINTGSILVPIEQAYHVRVVNLAHNDYFTLDVLNWQLYLRLFNCFDYSHLLGCFVLANESGAKGTFAQFFDPVPNTPDWFRCLRYKEITASDRGSV